MVINSNIGKSEKTQIAFWGLAIIIELTFLQLVPQSISGLIMTGLMVYLYVLCDASLEVAVIIIVANDALGTMLFGKGSFQYLLVFLLLLTVILNRRLLTLNGKDAIVDLLVLFASFELYFVGFVSLKDVLFTLLYYYAIVINKRYIENDELFINRLTFSFSVICVLISLHAAITGGVVYNEFDATKAYYIRKGLLGVGIGDPNYSSILICIGLVSTVLNKRFHLLYKLIAVFILLKALTITLSTSGIIAITVAVILILLINNNIPKKIKYITVAFFVLLIVISFYNSFPDPVKIPSVDKYIERILSKVDALMSGNWNTLTSKRSSISDTYWKYIEKEDLLHFLFGFNSLTCASDYVPHNTYIDFILQFGIIGSALYLYVLIKKFKNVIIEKSNLLYRKVVITLKVVFLLYMAALSIYQGSIFAIMMVILFVL